MKGVQTMAEYIEREALEQGLRQHFDTIYNEDGKLLYSDHICTAEDCEDLLKFIKQFPTADVVPVEWISVKDRLPKTNGKYLCTSYYKSTNSLHINLYWFTKDFYKLDRFDFSDKKGVGGFWDSDDEWGICHHENVTHWMPLPEPPKAEQKLKEMRGE
jgi:hypothetical protein